AHYARLAIETSVLNSFTINYCATDQGTVFLYPLHTMPKDVSLFRFIRFLKNVALKEGTIVIETSKDANKLNAIASANGLNISPTEPVTNANGRNTIIVTIVEDM